MSRFAHSDVVDLRLHLHWMTPDAIKVSVDGEKSNAVWLPKSKIGYPTECETGTVITVTMPEWLAVDKGLV